MRSRDRRDAPVRTSVILPCSAARPWCLSAAGASFSGYCLKRLRDRCQDLSTRTGRLTVNRAAQILTRPQLRHVWPTNHCSTRRDHGSRGKLCSSSRHDEGQGPERPGGRRADDEVDVRHAGLRDVEEPLRVVEARLHAPEPQPTTFMPASRARRGDRSSAPAALTDAALISVASRLAALAAGGAMRGGSALAKAIHDVTNASRRGAPSQAARRARLSAASCAAPPDRVPRRAPRTGGELRPYSNPKVGLPSPTPAGSTVMRARFTAPTRPR